MPNELIQYLAGHMECGSEDPRAFDEYVPAFMSENDVPGEDLERVYYERDDALDLVRELVRSIYGAHRTHEQVSPWDMSDGLQTSVAIDCLWGLGDLLTIDGHLRPYTRAFAEFARTGGIPHWPSDTPLENIMSLHDHMFEINETELERCLSRAPERLVHLFRTAYNDGDTGPKGEPIWGILARQISLARTLEAYLDAGDPLDGPPIVTNLGQRIIVDLLWDDGESFHGRGRFEALLR